MCCGVWSRNVSSLSLSSGTPVLLLGLSYRVPLRISLHDQMTISINQITFLSYFIGKRVEGDDKHKGLAIETFGMSMSAQSYTLREGSAYRTALQRMGDAHQNIGAAQSDMVRLESSCWGFLSRRMSIQTNMFTIHAITMAPCRSVGSEAHILNV